MNTNSKMVRTRFAPSPTGYLHIGSLRTSLFAFLFARHHGGKNILRIEDTDQTRKVDDAVEKLVEVLAVMGIEFDEGPVMEAGKIVYKGEFGPYVQSERLEKYQSFAKQLVENKKAYYCFCSSQRLDELRKEQTALKKPPMYDGLCKNLSEQEVQANLSAKQPCVVRQAIPKEGKTVVSDLVYGDINYDNALLDDQILLKSDGFPTYHLAVVVDDHLMEITHVIRAEEWIPSTPKHVLLYQAFGWEPPAFAHLPLIVNPDKTKLSKRQGDVAVEDYLQKGYLPEALVNFVALLGWNPKTEQEIFDMQGLIDNFDLSKVNKSSAVFDVNKLDWMNSQYIKSLSNDELLKFLVPILISNNFSVEGLSQEYLSSVVAIEKERIKTFPQILDHASFYFAEPEYDGGVLVWKKADSTDAKQKLLAVKEFLQTLSDEDFEINSLEEKLKNWIGEQGFETGNVLWPLRVSLTGLPKSPSPFEMLSCLYKKDKLQTILARIERAVEKL